MNRLRLALVGYGGMGSYHIRRVKDIAEFEVAGIFDIDAARVSAATQDGYKCYASAADILRDDVDGVIIATPNDLHFSYAELFLHNKIAVLCEKPAMMDTVELQKIITLSERSKTVFTVNQNRRLDKDFLVVTEIIRQNILNGVYRIESRVTGGNGIPDGWRKIKKHGGGMMPDWGVHLIDQMLLAVDAKVDSLICSYSYIAGCEVEDGFWLELTFDNGVTAHIAVDTNTFINAPRWRVLGYDGTAQITSWDLQGSIVKPKTDAPYGTGMVAGNGFTRTMAYRSSDETITLPLPDASCDSDALYKNFAAAIRNGEPTLIKHAQLLRVMRLMEVAAQSASGAGLLTNLAL